MTRTYDNTGYREIGRDQPHSRTEYLTNEGRTISMGGTGEEVRRMLRDQAEEGQ